MRKEDYILQPERFISLLYKLEAWRKERHIDGKDQITSLYANLLEEQAELERALLANDQEGVIDAYCDMVVFLLNAYDINDWFSSQATLDRTIRLAHLPIKTSVLNNIRWSINKEVRLICVEQVKNINKEVYHFVAFIFQVLYMYGYDPISCMEEVIKHISSRKGSWDESIKKFVKDTSEEAKSQWYEADFEKCKIKS